MVHWVVEHAVHNLLVCAGVLWVTLENFADAVNARRIVKVSPKVFLDVPDCVDSEAIN